MCDQLSPSQLMRLDESLPSDGIGLHHATYLLIGEQLKLEDAGLLRIAGVVKARRGGGLLVNKQS